jgi:hypothetical protein
MLFTSGRIAATLAAGVILGSVLAHADEAAMGSMPPMPAMTGMLGGYAFTRDASGTSWQPDTSVHQGLHVMTSDWMFMAHGRITGVYDWQNGPRGDDHAFVEGMVMGEARRTFAGGDALTFRGMLSPDPLMGPRGYPLLLASGETANGITPLIDRQHPHDLFMELSATYRHALSNGDAVFLYAGLPGEPAFGPPAFMHRMSIMDSPEAPITHHWLDSTHITFGVVTGGYVHDDWKVEASGFKGREPNQHRADIEAPRLDSTSARLSWNPTERLALQVSWAQVTSPEQLEPLHDQTRLSASAIYTVPLNDGWWSTTAAWGRRRLSGEPWLDAFALESAVHFADAWTVFGRAELINTDELSGTARSDRAGKASLGLVHDWSLGNVKLGIGGLYSANWLPGALRSSYGGQPGGAMIFTRILID